VKASVRFWIIIIFFSGCLVAQFGYLRSPLIISPTQTYPSPLPSHPNIKTGGHVIFSHYHYFDALLDKVNPDWCERQRVCYIWQKARFIPYPYQNNIHRLPPQDFQKCMDGLTELEAHKKQQQQQDQQQQQHSSSSNVSLQEQTRPRNFLEWLQNGFGQGILDLFMVPYNRKVWGYVHLLLLFLLLACLILFSQRVSPFSNESHGL